MKCIRCGKEFDEGIFCPVCGQRCDEPEFQNNKEELLEEDMMLYTMSDSDMKQEESNDAERDGIIAKKKRPVILSIPIIFLVGFFTYGIGAIIMGIIRLKKYPEKLISSIVIMAIWGSVLLISVAGILGTPRSETKMAATNANDSASKRNDDTLNGKNGKEAKEITNNDIYETISEWQESGFSLIKLGFPKNMVELSSVHNIEAVYTDKNDKKSDIIAEVEFQEEGYQYYLKFIYAYSEEEDDWYAKDIEKCRGTEWVMSQPTDKEIADFFIEKEAKGEYSYSDLVINEREQEYTTFTAKASCTVSSLEGNKQADYIFEWEWEDEEWDYVKMLEPEPSRFKPIDKPNEDFIAEFISQEEASFLQNDDGRKRKIELVGEDWNKTDEDDSYLYECLRIENTRLVETRQNMEAEIKFNGETGYWDYENVFWNYDENIEKIYTIDGTWEGVEYETFEASWKYVVEILSVDLEDNAITINSWCEFTTGDGEPEKTQVCNGEKMTQRQGEYTIPVGGYIVEHTASKGMNFTYEFVEEEGKLFINEEADILYLSVQNPKMSIVLGVEMSLVE